MLKNRLFNVVIVVALLVMVALLIHQTFATAQVISDNGNLSMDLTNSVQAELCPFTPEEIRSIQAVYVKEIGVWLPRTTREFTGVDGGLDSLHYCPAPGK